MSEKLNSLFKLDPTTLTVTRRLNQCLESEQSVRIRGGRSRDEVEDDSGKQSIVVDKREPDHTTEHQKLTQKIHETIRIHSEMQGSSMGLNRQTRHGTKSVAGTAITNSTETFGNSANAKMSAQARASAAVRRRRKIFAGLPHEELLATAQMDLVSRLKNGSYGLVMVDAELLIGKVITMYEKGTGNNGKHCWVADASNIGSVSYLKLQTWQQVRTGSRQFRALHRPTMSLGISRFAHIPGHAFLYRIPDSFIRISDSKVNLDGKFYDDVLSKLLSIKSALVGAVRLLMAPPKQSEIVVEEDAEIVK
ncbi:hypothetical protein PM082_009516 [Marasmius tenuissimus]|nr:hypothetical protein PM082_009516 [Marasmius tenuissimus]